MSTILVVEDTEDNYDLIADAFEDEHDLVRAITGPEALAQAATIRPDLILLDMGLPVFDGFEVVRRLKADAELVHVPVVALTSHAMTGDREKCMEAGCDDYLSKPIDVRELRGLVEQYLANKHTILKG